VDPKLTPLLNACVRLIGDEVRFMHFAKRLARFTAIHLPGCKRSQDPAILCRLAPPSSTTRKPFLSCSLLSHLKMVSRYEGSHSTSRVSSTPLYHVRTNSHLPGDSHRRCSLSGCLLGSDTRYCCCGVDGAWRSAETRSWRASVGGLFRNTQCRNEVWREWR
jgi:hypothetical protein